MANYLEFLDKTRPRKKPEVKRTDPKPEQQSAIEKKNELLLKLGLLKKQINEKKNLAPNLAPIQ